MSRAFTSERDGWSYCPIKKDECIFAGADGQCTLSQCKFGIKRDNQPENKAKAEKPED